MNREQGVYEFHVYSHIYELEIIRGALQMWAFDDEFA